jgi:hypothetical protein
MLRAAVIVLLIALLPSHARAEARIALLVGNQGYSDKVGVLKNPHNDVRLLEAALKRLGFKVSVLMDAGYRDMDSAIKENVGTVRKAGPRTISADQKRDPRAHSKRADRGQTCWEPS